MASSLVVKEVGAVARGAMTDGSHDDVTKGAGLTSFVDDTSAIDDGTMPPVMMPFKEDTPPPKDAAATEDTTEDTPPPKDAAAAKDTTTEEDAEWCLSPLLGAGERGKSRSAANDGAWKVARSLVARTLTHDGSCSLCAIEFSKPLKALSAILKAFHDDGSEPPPAATIMFEAAVRGGFASIMIPALDDEEVSHGTMTYEKGASPVPVLIFRAFGINKDDAADKAALDALLFLAHSRMDAAAQLLAEASTPSQVAEALMTLPTTRRPRDAAARRRARLALFMFHQAATASEMSRAATLKSKAVLAAIAYALHAEAVAEAAAEAAKEAVKEAAKEAAEEAAAKAKKAAEAAAAKAVKGTSNEDEENDEDEEEDGGIKVRAFLYGGDGRISVSRGGDASEFADDLLALLKRRFGGGAATAADTPPPAPATPTTTPSDGAAAAPVTASAGGDDDTNAEEEEGDDEEAPPPTPPSAAAAAPTATTSDDDDELPPLEPDVATGTATATTAPVPPAATTYSTAVPAHVYARVAGSATASNVEGYARFGRAAVMHATAAAARSASGHGGRSASVSGDAVSFGGGGSSAAATNDDDWDRFAVGGGAREEEDA